jgi:predicted MPP superfamily phosphohydrolase
MFVWLLAVLLAVGACCVGYGVFIERKAYRMIRQPALPILPAGSEPLTLLHLSDLHFVRVDDKKARFIAGLPRADVTVVTGDFLAEHEAVGTTVAAVRPAKGRLASYFVLGSNDIYVPKPLNPLRYFVRRRKVRLGTHGRTAELIAQLEADGWIHLMNERRETLLGELPVEVVGLNDPHIHRDDLRVAPRHSPENFGLAIVPAPEPAPELVALGYDLVVSGHTHGGQVRAPWGPLVNNSSLPLSITVGLFRFGPSFLHISQGLGTSKYAPFRFLAPPQVEWLELVARKPA